MEPSSRATNPPIENALIGHSFRKWNKTRWSVFLWAPPLMDEGMTWMLCIKMVWHHQISLFLMNRISPQGRYFLGFRLVIPRISECGYGARAFSHQAPLLQKHLPASVLEHPPIARTVRALLGAFRAGGGLTHHARFSTNTSTTLKLLCSIFFTALPEHVTGPPTPTDPLHGPT